MSGSGMIAAALAGSLPEECRNGCEWCRTIRAGLCGPITAFERLNLPPSVYRRAVDEGVISPNDPRWRPMNDKLRAVK